MSGELWIKINLATWYCIFIDILVSHSKCWTLADKLVIIKVLNAENYKILVLDFNVVTLLFGG